MNKRIFISGVSGVGKTTLAKFISEKFAYHFLNLSAKELYPEYGIKNHKDLITRELEDVEFAIEFENKLLDHRIAKVQEYRDKNFVTDRSFLDNIVYFIYKNGHRLTTEQTEVFMNRAMNKLVEVETHHIHIAFTNDIKLEDDQQRIVNMYFQSFLDAYYRSIITEIIGRIHTIKTGMIITWDWQTRKKSVINLITDLHIPGYDKGKARDRK